jgi:DnaJ-domain-containing protein 1
MSFSSRLWRVLRGVSPDFEDVDPDDLLRKLREARRQAQAAGQSFRAGGSRSKSPGKSSSNKTSGLPDDVARAYSRLELSTNGSVDDAKKAWRKLMRKYHPDRHQADEHKREVATKLAAALTESYEIIKDYREKYG